MKRTLTRPTAGTAYAIGEAMRPFAPCWSSVQNVNIEGNARLILLVATENRGDVTLLNMALGPLDLTAQFSTDSSIEGHPHWLNIELPVGSDPSIVFELRAALNTACIWRAKMTEEDGVITLKPFEFDEGGPYGVDIVPFDRSSIRNLAGVVDVTFGDTSVTFTVATGHRRIVIVHQVAALAGFHMDEDLYGGHFFGPNQDFWLKPVK